MIGWHAVVQSNFLITWVCLYIICCNHISDEAEFEVLLACCQHSGQQSLWGFTSLFYVFLDLCLSTESIDTVQLGYSPKCLQRHNWTLGGGISIWKKAWERLYLYFKKGCGVIMLVMKYGSPICLKIQMLFVIMVLEPFTNFYWFLYELE